MMYLVLISKLYPGFLAELYGGQEEANQNQMHAGFIKVNSILRQLDCLSSYMAKWLGSTRGRFDKVTDFSAF